MFRAEVNIYESFSSHDYLEIKVILGGRDRKGIMILKRVRSSTKLSKTIRRSSGCSRRVTDRRSSEMIFFDSS